MKVNVYVWLCVFLVSQAAAHERIVGDIDGRAYIAYLPDDYDTRRDPMSILLALHPATFDAQWFQGIARIELEDEAEDLIVIYPDGSAGVAGGLSWDAADPRGTDRGDTQFLFDVVAQIQSSFNTHERFAVTGFSAGALMTY
jgi:poly(3-hydroxybutyrate) depolymerase